ncbi:MAG: DUF1902 domain-containing protein [Candidatus Binataceae bacterium]|nr:DUF1902 domain-containing protein [Candidatus Binataceae bacterium]
MENRTYLVRAIWDGEAGVWVAESDDVPGLIAEAASPGELNGKLAVLIPELLELNEIQRDRKSALQIVVQYRGEERLSLPAAA